MMRKLTLLLGALCGLYGGLQAQRCGFDDARRDLLASSPAYREAEQANTQRLRDLLQHNPNAMIVNTANGPVYEIPVVIHVIHTGGAVGTPYNPSATTLGNMISYLNATYAATWSTYPSATSGGTAFPVRFALATRGPGCAATGGINRIDGSAALGTNYTTYGVRRSGTNGITDANVKALSRWNRDDYYNIWVVNRIDGNDGTTGTFVAGYAYLPGAPASVDGTVMLATQSTAGNITLPHEIGHAFNLLHIFEGDDPGGTGSATTCPTNTNCATQGDEVCDTEPMRRTLFTCPTGVNPCTGVTYANGQRNFMDYSSCQDRFTAGQRTRFIAALTNFRPGLISSTASSTSTATAPAASCTPTITNASNTSDAGISSVVFSDMVARSTGGYNSDGNQHYIDRSCTQQANVTAGQTYNISVRTGPGREYVRVYIDYNNDGAFNATTELAYSHNGTASVPFENHTGTVTIPATVTASCTPLRMRVVSDLFSTGTPPGPCSALGFGQAEDFSVVVKPALPTVNIAFASGSGNPSCAGSPLTFNATSSSVPTGATWRWYVNGTATVATTSSFTISTLATGDVVTAQLSYTTGCGADSVMSSGITVNRSAVVTPSATIAVTSGSNPGCLGTAIGFTATPTNGGSAPTYQWYVGSTLQTGVTGNTFSSSSIPCNTNVYAVLTSSSTCAVNPVATSNTITYACGNVLPSVAISVTAGSNPTCIGRAITFLATPTNGGSAPTYQWFVNGSAIPGATGVSYTNNAYVTGDAVTVRMVSNYACASVTTVTSAAVYIVTIPNMDPVVARTITRGSNPGCKDSVIEFSAAGVNAGAAPSFAWFINGVEVSSNAVYANTTANDGDRLWVRMIPSGIGSACYSRDTVYSDTVTLQRRTTPSLPVISFIGKNLVSDSANVQWYGPAGLIPGAVGSTYAPTATGTYYAVIRNPLCGTGRSNILIVNPLSVGSYNMEGVTLFPNPTSGALTITWTSPTTTRITVYTSAGQAVAREVASITTSKTIDLSALASGTYFVNLEDEHGKAGTVRVTVSH